MAEGPLEVGRSGLTRLLDDNAQPATSKYRWLVSRFNLNSGLWFLAVAGLVVLGVYSASSHGGGALATALITAGAAGATGALVGLLFGVPRSNPREKADDTEHLVSANTNLEQISDWLTKLIIGATLTQLTELRRDFGALSSLVAPGLGGGVEAAPVAGATIVLFSVIGFLIGWFFARLRLGAAMSQADAAIALGRRAERASQSGDEETAQTIRNVAKTVGISQVNVDLDSEIQSLADRYERIRDNITPGPGRTRQLEDIVVAARRLARRHSIVRADVISMFRSGTAGQRIVALGAMQTDPRVADFESVLDAIVASRSAFEQFHALLVAEGLVPHLSETDRVRLTDGLTSSSFVRNTSGDTSRASLAKELLSLLEAPSAPQSGQVAPSPAQADEQRG